MKKIVSLFLTAFILASVTLPVTASTKVQEITDSSLEASKIITSHSAQSRTKEEISEKYIQSKPTFDYSSSVYEAAPSLTAPYYEGILKAEPVQDTLRCLNYYRWLAGMDSLTLNSQYMARSQKGAAIMAINKELTHSPSRPAGMTDSFYEDACNGVGAQVGYSGNISYGSTSWQSIKSYIDDVRNISGGVGHRVSLLDPAGTQASFGWCEKYGAISIYYDSSRFGKDEFYSWPAPGYFPSESINSSAEWSLTLKPSYTYSDNVNISIEYNGKSYNTAYSQYYKRTNSISYKIPTEIISGAAVSDTFRDGTNIKITITGISDSQGNSTAVSYTTSFFVAEKVPVEKIKIYRWLDSNTAISLLSSFTMTRGQEERLLFVYTPENTTEKEITVALSDPEIATWDSSSNTLKAVKEGKTTFTVTSVDSPSVSASFSLEVLKGEPLLGDVNDDGEVNLIDVVFIQRYLASIIEFSDEQLKLADADKDGYVKMTDVVHLQKYIAGIVDKL